MLYKARVIDTSMFTDTGKIRIRIFDKAHGKYDNSDLSGDGNSTISENSEQVITDNGTEIQHNDQEAYVSSPIGGGYDYGMFYLPQVNSVGIVSDLGDTTNTDNLGEYVWMGALFQHSVMSDGDVNIPSDSLATKNGVTEGAYINKENGSFIFKQKSTTLYDPLTPISSKSTLNWKKRPIENLLVMSKNYIKVIHNISDGYEEMIMDVNGINIQRHKESTTTVDTKFNIDSEGLFTIKKTEQTGSDTSTATTLSITTTEGNEIETTVENSTYSSSLIQGADNITMSTDKANLQISSDDESGEVRISIPKGAVNIYAESVHLGGGDHQVLTLEGKCPEGAVPSNNVYA